MHKNPYPLPVSATPPVLTILQSPIANLSIRYFFDTRIEYFFFTHFS
jgi:hypothetical protein